MILYNYSEKKLPPYPLSCIKVRGILQNAYSKQNPQVSSYAFAHACVNVQMCCMCVPVFGIYKNSVSDFWPPPWREGLGPPPPQGDMWSSEGGGIRAPLSVQLGMHGILKVCSVCRNYGCSSETKMQLSSPSNTKRSVYTLHNVV